MPFEIHAVNTIRASGFVALPASAQVVTGSAEGIASYVTNEGRYSAASFEDYSINWTDFSFEYLADD